MTYELARQIFCSSRLEEGPEYSGGHFNRRRTQMNGKYGRKFIGHSADAALESKKAC